jgi:hypothetical protein
LIVFPRRMMESFRADLIHCKPVGTILQSLKSRDRSSNLLLSIMLSNPEFSFEMTLGRCGVSRLSVRI